MAAESQRLEGLRGKPEEAESLKMHAFITRARLSIDPGLLERGRKEIVENRYRTAEQIRSGRSQDEGDRE